MVIIVSIRKLETLRINSQGSTEPVKPVLAYPAGGVTVYESSPTLNWYINQWASHLEYHLQLSLTDDFINPILDVIGIDGLSYKVQGLSAEVTYYTRVRSFNSEGSYSEYSSTGSFTVWAGDYPVVPVAASPSGGVSIHSGSATLSWYSPAGSTEEQKYDLQISTDKSFTEYNQVSGLDTMSYNFRDLKGETKYFWRVRAMTSDGKTSPYSSEGTFITSKLTNVALRSDNQIPKDFDLKQNYPNPFNPVTTIEFSLPKDEHVRLVVYDMLGRVAKELINGTLGAGNFKDSFKAEGLSSGVYIYKLSTPTFQKIKKMILQSRDGILFYGKRCGNTNDRVPVVGRKRQGPFYDTQV